MTQRCINPVGKHRLFFPAHTFGHLLDLQPWLDWVDILDAADWSAETQTHSKAGGPQRQGWILPGPAQHCVRRLPLLKMLPTLSPSLDFPQFYWFLLFRLSMIKHQWSRPSAMWTGSGKYERHPWALFSSQRSCASLSVCFSLHF